MAEKTAGSVWAVEFFGEGCALFGFVFFILGLQLFHQFLAAMGELTLGSIPAVAYFNPIFAHFCFKFGLIRFNFLRFSQISLLVFRV